MMEQEELELIKRLQNTQIMQKTAYDDLENALNGSFNKGENQSLLMSPGNNNNEYRGHTPNSKGSVMASGGTVRPQTSQSSSGVKYKQGQQQLPQQKNI